MMKATGRYPHFQQRQNLLEVHILTLLCQHFWPPVSTATGVSSLAVSCRLISGPLEDIHEEHSSLTNLTKAPSPIVTRTLLVHPVSQLLSLQELRGQMTDSAGVHAPSGNNFFFFHKFLVLSSNGVTSPA